MNPSHEQVLWRRVDTPGHEAARLLAHGAGWLLVGTAVFAHQAEPCRLDYRVRCDAAWRTLSAHVEGWIGGREVVAEITADAEGSWHLDGERCDGVQGCTDIDLNFSPSTNLLPIRRLRLEVGEAAPVRAAWLRFPSFALEPLEQVYRRSEAKLYRYESAGGAFVADLQVNAAGFVTRYPGVWQEETFA